MPGSFCEGTWEVRDLIALLTAHIEHGQRGVEVVVVRVDELEAHDRQVLRLARFGMRARVGAEAGAGEEPLAGDEEVAFAFVYERGRLVVAEPGGTQPFEVRRTLSRALLVAELGG